MSAKNKKELIEKLSEALLKIGALKVGSFQTSGGNFTPYFIDLKIIVSFPDVLDLAISCLHNSLEELDPMTLCGVPTSGLLLASIIARDLKRPLVYPASTSRESSTKVIRGILKPGSRVVVIDDVSETGLSIRSAIQSIQSSGGVVENAVTIIDREEEAAKVLGQLGVKLLSFTTIGEIIDTLRKRLALTEEQEQAIEAGYSARLVTNKS